MSYRARRAVIAIAAIVLLAGCGRHDGAAQAESDAKGFVPPAPVPVKPMAGQASSTPLDAYIGHDPHDPVDGVEFFDRTDVSTALVAAVKDERVRKEFREGPGAARPIFARGNAVAASGCTGQDCATGNWTFLLDRDSGKGVACFHDAKMGATSHWYDGGAHPATRAGDCPSS